MKKVILFSIVCLPVITLQAQQGTIVYERKIDVHRRLEDEQMKAMVPQFRTSKHVLLFGDSISVYKAVQEEEEAPDPFEAPGAGPRVMIRMDRGENNIIYKNFTTQQLEEQTELADKPYIIDDTIRNSNWKLTGESKQVQGHPCRKALMTTARGSEVTAWYATDITVPAGPELFDGLPGAILLVDVNNGEVVFTASEIKDTFNRKELAAPKEGTHVTRRQFQQKMDEVMGPAGADGRRMIRRM